MTNNYPGLVVYWLKETMSRKRTTPITFVLAFLMLSQLLCQSQNLLETKITSITHEQSLENFLIDFEKASKVKFFFLPEWIKSFQVNPSHNQKTLKELLAGFFDNSSISFSLLNNYSLIFIKDPGKLIERERLLQEAFTKKKVVKRITIGTPNVLKPESLAFISGKIIDLKNDDPVIGATVILDSGLKAVTTDESGKFEIVVPIGSHIIRFRYVNYEEQIIDLDIFENGVLNIRLGETPFLLDEIVISDEASQDITSRNIGLSSIKIGEIKRLPTFLGEVDIIKQLQTQAGVTTVGEGASGYNVRGGSVDQNLILLDGIPVFNVSHVFGFFTAFNAESVKSVDFYKGGIPAEYGGKASSVLKIVTKEGDSDKWHANGGVGILTSQVTFGGPIKKDVTTLSASIRSTYSDWVLKTVSSNYGGLRNSSVNFYDGNLKLAHKLSEKSKLVFSVYSSQDQFRLTNDTTYGWKNLTASVRFDHSFNGNLFSSFQVGYGQYGYEVQDVDNVAGFKLNYNIKYPTLRWDLNYSLEKHKFTFGWQATYADFSPGSLTPSQQSSQLKAKSLDKEIAIENSFYVSDTYLLKGKLEIIAGLRLSIFDRLGPGKIYGYKNNQPLESFTRTDTTVFKKGAIIKEYYGLEPRLSLSYPVTENSSLKASYNRMYQYNHLISNTASIAPVDIWQLSNRYIKPQIADQFSVGYFSNSKNRIFETSIEAFYKSVQNILDYKDGANLILNSGLETALLSGISKSYGVEASIFKTKGRLTGSLNYTFARSLRQINGATPIERINNGDYYPSNFDQPHVINLTWKLSFTKRLFFSGLFTYHTGRPVSIPTSAYSAGGIVVSDFSERNQYRIPDYHRLDLAFIIEGNHKRKKLWEGSWVISCYNFYGRKNAFSVFFADNNSGALEAYKLSIIGTIIPSIGYNFKF